MNIKLRSSIAGAVGMVVAFGVVELVHGLYPAVPSVLVAVAQRIIEFTPGDFATRAVEILGKADIPVLVTVTVLSTLALAGVLAYLSLRSWIVALLGVGALAAVALAASFSEPTVSPLATVLTDLGALGIGSAVAVFLLHTSSELRPSGPGPKPESPGTEDKPGSQGVRSREAHSARGVVVGRRRRAWGIEPRYPKFRIRNPTGASSRSVTGRARYAAPDHASG